jgi:hypothetical protein
MLSGYFITIKFIFNNHLLLFIVLEIAFVLDENLKVSKTLISENTNYFQY